VSYQNAIARGESVISAVLHAAGLPASLIFQLEPHHPVLNTRLNWVETELARLFNGVAAHELGMPQDELCHAIGEFRHPRVIFDFPNRMGALDQALLGTLSVALNHRRREYLFTEFPTANEAYHRLMLGHRDCFSNLIFGEVFPDKVPSVVTMAEIEWTDFMYENKKATGAAVDQLLRNHPSIGGITDSPRTGLSAE
jgi:hypothetical protein